MLIFFCIVSYEIEKNQKLQIINEQDLLNEEKSWRTILQNLPVGFLTVNKNGKEIQFSNHMAKKMLKIKKDDKFVDNIFGSFKIVKNYSQKAKKLKTEKSPESF